MSIRKNESNLLIINVLCLILISFSPLLNQYIKFAILILLIIFSLRGAKTSNHSRTLYFISVILIFLFGALSDWYNATSLEDYSLLNFYYPLTFIFGYLFSKKYTVNEYLYSFHKLIFIFAVFSLFGVAIFHFIPDLVSRLPSYTYYHTTHKTALFFNFLMTEEGDIIRRNVGIAWEPGAFQILLNLGLYSYLLISKNKISISVIFTYIIAIFFTRSTVGLLILFFQILNIIKLNRYYTYILIGVFLMFSVNIIDEINYQFEYKFYGSYSFEGRFKPMIEAYEYGRNNIFGLGNTGYNNLLDVGIGSFDSYSQMVVRYGFILLFLIGIGLFRIIKHDLLLFLIIFISFFGLTIWFFPLLTPFYFFIYEKNKKIRCAKNI